MVVYAILIVAAFFVFRSVPAGFVPAQDKQYLVGFAQLPDAASLDRTEDVIRRMSDIGLKTEGVERRSRSRACRSTASSTRPNAGIVFFTLKDFDQRKGKALSGGAIAAEDQPAARVDQRRVHHGLPAAAGERPRHHRRLQALRRGPRQRRLRRAVQGDRRGAGEGRADAGARRRVLGLPDQRAAAVRRRRPHEGEAARRAARRHLQHDADQPRLAVRQRLQQVRPDVPGDRAGRRAVPLARAGPRPAEGQQRQGRDGPAVER